MKIACFALRRPYRRSIHTGTISSELPNIIISRTYGDFFHYLEANGTNELAYFTHAPLDRVNRLTKRRRSNGEGSCPRWQEIVGLVKFPQATLSNVPHWEIYMSCIFFIAILVLHISTSLCTALFCTVPYLVSYESTVVNKILFRNRWYITIYFHKRPTSFLT